MEKANSFVSSLKEKYSTEDLSKNSQRRHFNTDVLLFQKWAHRIPKGWYGFSLSPAPNSWAKIIDEFLAWLEVQDPTFEIHQIKLKFGGLRFYVGLNITHKPTIEMIHNEIEELESWLSDESLIY